MNDTAKTDTCPPLTPDDIYVLRGKPAAKNVVPADSNTRSREEWIYYHNDAKTQEHYVFRDGRLVGWTKYEEGSTDGVRSRNS
ncbi:MAG: hypothetical protein HZA48_03480 [Planctomycetes bacterium]|nr:hypothetical protein [Planctomycetota bacterium]